MNAADIRLPRKYGTSRPLTEWQAATTPDTLPHSLRRNMEPGDDGCWLWARSKSRDGYGWASLDDKTHQAHRLIYRLLKGDPPEGMHLDHLCRVRHCVNPDHLEPVTPRENLLRGDTQTAWTCCQKCGGEYSQLHGQRRCLRCLDEYRKNLRKKAA